MSKSISNALYDSLSENMRLLVKMMMIGIWIVKASHLYLGEKGSISQENLASRVEERLTLACNTPDHIELIIIFIFE